jgi:pyridoxal biosynthesis lyase PdxS
MSGTCPTFADMTNTTTATAQAALSTIPPDIRCAQDYERLAQQFMVLPIMNMLPVVVVATLLSRQI